MVDGDAKIVDDFDFDYVTDEEDVVHVYLGMNLKRSCIWIWWSKIVSQDYLRTWIQKQVT